MAAVGTRLLQVEIDGDEFSLELTSAKLSAADSDSDTVTFADAAAGGAKDYTLNFTAVQDASADSLWTKIFDNAGDDVACTFIPYGNATPSVDEPHFTFNANIPAPDGDFLGGDANSSTTEKFTFDSAWPLDAKPTKVTTTGS